MLFGKKSPVDYAIDLGFNHVKDAYEVSVIGENGEPRKELRHQHMLSIAARRSTYASDLATEGDVIGLTDGSEWVVGTKGSYSLKASRLEDPSDWVRFYAALGNFQKDVDTDVIDHLITGLPIVEYMARKAQLKQALERIHRFRFNGKERHMKVGEASVIPQSAGAYYGYVLDEYGDIQMSIPYLLENILTLDIGGKTSDGCAMKALKYDDDNSFTIYEAMINVQKELGRLIMKRYQYNAQPVELDKAIRTGKLQLGGSVENVEDLITIAMETRYPYMESELSLNIPDFRYFAAILLVGGGAYRYKDFIQEVAGIPVITVPNPEFANAIGYLRYAKMVRNNRR